jgi:hypothetical protein
MEQPPNAVIIVRYEIKKINANGKKACIVDIKKIPE